MSYMHLVASGNVPPSESKDYYSPDWEIGPNNIPYGGTFSRGTLATQVNADETIGWCPHNLLTNSGDFTKPSWYHGANGNSVPTEWSCTPVAGPSTDLQGYAVSRSSSNGSIAHNVSVQSGLTYFCAFYIRVASGSAQATITIGSLGSTVVNVTTSWQRFSLSATAGSTGTQQVFVTLAANTPYEIAAASASVGSLQPYYPTNGTPYYGLRTQDYSDDPARAGIKIEPQATNINPYSGTLTETGWQYRSGMVITNGSTVGPDGTTLCSNFSKGTSTDGYVFRNSGWTPAATTNYTASVYAKGTGTFYFKVWDGAAVYQGNPITLTSSWKRYSFSFTTTTVGLYPDFGLMINSTNINLFGYQIETGLIPTSYIPTNGAAVTRGADNWTIAAASISKWNSSAASFYLESRHPKNPLSTGILSGNFFTSTELCTVRDYQNQGFGSWDGVTENNAPSPADYTGFNKWSAAYEAGMSSSVTHNGLTPSVQPFTATGLSGANVLHVGSKFGSAHFCGTIYSLKYYARALPSSKLQALTL